MQYGSLRGFLCDKGFGEPPKYERHVEESLPPGSGQEVSTVLAHILLLCKRLNDADPDVDDFVNSTFESCVPPPHYRYVIVHMLQWQPHHGRSTATHGNFGKWSHMMSIVLLQ